MHKDIATTEGVYHFEHVRNGVVIDTWDTHNLIPAEGRNYLLNVGFKGLTASPSWFVGLFSGNYSPIDSDSASTFSATSNETTAFSEGARQAWTTTSSVASSIDNSVSRAQFTFTAVVNVYGAFLTNSVALLSTTGVLASAAKFPVSKSMTSGDVLRVTYAMSINSV